MTHEELLAKIDHMWDDNFDYVASCHTNALRAIVELHKPDEYGDCLGCENRCGCYEGDILEFNKWKTCPTIQAIEKELK